MAWTTPLTWTAGMVLGATDYNTQFRDNLNQLKSPSFAQTALNPTAVGSLTTTSTTWTAITAAAALTINTYGGALHCGFRAAAGGGFFLAFEVDGVPYTGIHPSGNYKADSGNSFTTDAWITEITASGAHTILPAWRVGAGTNTGALLCSGVPAFYWVREG